MSKTKPTKKEPKNIPKEPAVSPQKLATKQPDGINVTQGPGHWVPWLIAMLAIVILTSVAYHPALDNSFVDWDDATYVIDNDLVRQQNKQTTLAEVFKTPVSLNYHPLTILTMRWNANQCRDCEYGISAKPFIQWNIALHIVNALLVFVLTFHLSKKSWFVAAFCAAVFALHPMHVESVAWVSQRKDVLYVMYFLMGLLTYYRYLNQLFDRAQNPDFKWLAATFVFFLSACLSKAMAVVFPLVLILMHFWCHPAKDPIKSLRKSLAPRRILEYLPFFAVALFFGLMAMSVQSGGDFNGTLHVVEKSVAVNKFDTFSIFQRLQFSGYAFCTYLYNFFFPTKLAALHPYPTQVEYDNSPIFNLSLLFFVLILGAALLSLKKTKLFALGIGFYFVTVAVVLQFISVGVAITADRYSYLPYMGISFILGMLVEKLPKPVRYLSYGLTIFVAVAWLIKTREQVDAWQDSDALWTEVIKHYPRSEQAYSIRGNYYGKQIEAAKDTAKRGTLMRQAEYDFRKAIEYKSTRADVYEGLANIESMKGNTDEAIELYYTAIKHDPGKATAYINRGVALSMKGDLEAALKDMSKAVELDPDPTHIMYRGFARQSLGDLEGAKADYTEAIRLAPRLEEAKKRLRELGG